jgi:flagellar basal body-associated protein FliL
MKKISAFVVLCFALAFGAGQGVSVSYASGHGGGAKSEKKEGGEKGEKGEKKDAKKGGSAEDGEIIGGRFDGDPIYVRMRPLVLPVITNDGIEQLVTLALDVRVKDEDTADILHKNMPRLTDSLLRALYGGIDEGSLKNGKLVNLEKIKVRAVSAVSELVPRDKIVDVLIEGIAQRML